MRRALPLRIAGAAALAAFVAGGIHAAVTLGPRRHVLEFQAGEAAGAWEKLVAIAHMAAIEGVGFGLVGLVLGVLAVLPAGRPASARRGEETNERVVARLVLLAAGLVGWLAVSWVAEDALPFLAPGGLVLLNFAGLGGAVVVLFAVRGLIGLLPWTPADAPLARSLGVALAVLPAGLYAQSLLLAVSGGWRSPGRLVLAGAVILISLLLAVLLTRVLTGPLARLGRRIGTGPLVSPLVTWGLAGLLALCVAGTAPSFRLSALPARTDYEGLPQERRPDGPNVVLLTIDTLRADHLGCYGYDRPTSPFLDSLAAEGVRFDDPVAPAAWTKPSTGTILTGLYPSRHGALYHGSMLRLPEGERTLAEAFQDAGYVTAGFVSNPNIKAVFDFDRGFDQYFDSPVEDTLTLACVRGSWFGRMLMDLMRHQFNWKYENDVLQMNRHVEAWLAANGDRRFFLYLHYIDPHIPYSPPAAYREEFARDHGLALFNTRKELVGTDLYDGEIRYADDGIRELIDAFREEGIWDDTLFVVTSDHGEELFEHGVLGHGFSLFQPVVQVPLIMRGPAIPPGRVVEHPVQVLDLPATLLELAGLGDGRFGDGVSFADSVRVPEWSSPQPVFLENEFGQDDSNQRAFVFTGVRSGRWKLVLTEQNAFFPPQNPANDREALYDLEADPEERTNLIADPAHAELVAELLDELRRHARFLDETGFREVAPAALTPDIEASLRALGY